MKFVSLTFALIWIVSLGAATADPSDRRPDVIYMDQPSGIDLNAYVAAWPVLAPYCQRLKGPDRIKIENELRDQVTHGAHSSDGEWNLLAQLAWQRGDLTTADASVAKALALNPKQSLNWFQEAMVDFAHLRSASGLIERWKWQRRTRDAYQRTFELEPRNVSARYYLAYTYMNTPKIGGGDLNKALQLAEGGIALGQNGFYAVRADAHRLRGETEAAEADYDQAIRLRVIKLGGLLDAGQWELQRKQWPTAKRYFEWAIYCRPDSSKAYEGLGDYYLATGERNKARDEYKKSVQKDSKNETAKNKLRESSDNH